MTTMEAAAAELRQWGKVLAESPPPPLPTTTFDNRRPSSSLRSIVPSLLTFLSSFFFSILLILLFRSVASAIPTILCIAAVNVLLCRARKVGKTSAPYERAALPSASLRVLRSYLMGVGTYCCFIWNPVQQDQTENGEILSNSQV